VIALAAVADDAAALASGRPRYAPEHAAGAVASWGTSLADQGFAAANTANASGSRNSAGLSANRCM
jgi:hypothetical protein